MSKPTPEFVALVKDALDHLYVPLFLREHPLGDVMLEEALPPGPLREQSLRQALLDAIDRLRTSPSSPVFDRQRRAHQLLELRYVDGLHYRDIMRTLTISQSQYHREQRYALEVISALVWDTSRSRTRNSPESIGRVSLHTEVRAAAHDSSSLTDLYQAAREALEILGPVARQKGIALSESLPSRPVLLFGNRTAVRQLVISVLGYVLGGASGGRLVLTEEASGSGIVLRAVYEGSVSAPSLETPEETERLTVIRDLLESLHGELGVDRGPDRVAVAITLPLQRRSLLVIDDNPGMVQLVTRLLADQDYAVLSGGSVPEGLELARASRPDAILLDIMIPMQDGWDALQILKHDPATLDIPILVCTVLAERELAMALGAAEFIQKPPTRAGLLTALARWTAPQRLPAEAGRGQLAPS